MNQLECMALDCVHNKKCNCHCPNIKMSAKAGGVRCNSYEGLPDYKMSLKGDVEFGQDFNTSITCSAESCVFNVHFSCKAGKVKVEDKGKTCRTYYGM